MMDGEGKQQTAGVMRELPGWETNEGAGAGQVLNENGYNGAGNGVLDTAIKKPSGRWQPGQSGNITGRPAKDKALLVALNNHYPPERIIEMVQAAYDSAETRDSWRGMLEVARFLTEYIIGKPVARSISISSKAGDMLARLEAIQLGGDGDSGDAGNNGDI